MTRGEALKAAAECLDTVKNAQLSSYSNSQYAELMRAKAEAGRAYIELARELDKLKRTM